MERLRLVAQAGPLEHRVLVQESAAALARLDDDGAGLLLSCRRLLERHPASGPLWWLCARVVCGGDVRAEAWACVEELDGDPTPARLAAELPAHATVALVGWPEVAAEAIVPRGDVRALVVDARGEGAELVRRLGDIGAHAVEVDDAGLGPAVLASDLVLLEASAVGPSAFAAPCGSRAAAAVARAAGVPVWLVAGAGRVLPPGLWAASRRRPEADRPWESADEVVPLEVVDEVVRPHGRAALPGGARLAPECPDAPELS